MTTATTARNMYELLEPICVVTYTVDECNQELAALGHPTYWDGYFASRAGPLGRVPAEVVHAAFYSFAEGEAARHIPSAWEEIPPEASSPHVNVVPRPTCAGFSATNWPTPPAWRAPPT